MGWFADTLGAISCSSSFLTRNPRCHTVWILLSPVGQRLQSMTGVIMRVIIIAKCTRKSKLAENVYRLQTYETNYSVESRKKSTGLIASGSIIFVVICHMGGNCVDMQETTSRLVVVSVCGLLGLWPFRFVVVSVVHIIQIMAWCRPGNKPLSEPMLTPFTDAYMRHEGDMITNTFNISIHPMIINTFTDGSAFFLRCPPKLCDQTFIREERQNGVISRSLN